MRPVEVERRYQPRLPLLNVDPQQMEQVLLNLLINAVQAMDFRGRLSLSTEARNGNAYIRIRDTGPGVPDGVASRIFEPFFTTRSKGTGLGLAIVDKIVRAHHGTVRVTSPVEGTRGTELELSLPVEA
jgi:signal transduction histidine kinase